jgi:dTMP kinase
MSASTHSPARRFPFVVLEGCDGVGKSTIRDELYRQLSDGGLEVMMVGQHAWLQPRVARLMNAAREARFPLPPDQITEAYFKDKRLHAEATVRPALQRAWMIADRYILSDAVYQEAIYGIPAETTLERHRAAGTLMPDLVIYVSVDVDEAYRRIERRAQHKRHYERPADMIRIMEVYHRVLFVDRLWRARTVHFVNDAPDWQETVRSQLIPKVLEQASHLVMA